MSEKQMAHWFLWTCILIVVFHVIRHFAGFESVAIAVLAGLQARNMVKDW